MTVAWRVLWVVIMVLAAGCIRLGEDAVGEYKEGQYKDWLDFRFHTIVIQEVNLTFEDDEVVASVTLENVGNATPGVDSPWAFVSASFASASLDLENVGSPGTVTVTMTGKGRTEDAARFYTSHASERKGVPHVTRYETPFSPGMKRILEMATWVDGSSAAEDRWWRAWANAQSTGPLHDPQTTTTNDNFSSGCQNNYVPEFYGRWDGMKCGVRDWCEIGYVSFQNCPDRPVQAKYYGDPDDEGIPPGPAWLES